MGVSVQEFFLRRDTFSSITWSGQRAKGREVSYVAWDVVVLIWDYPHGSLLYLTNLSTEFI